MMSLNWRLMYGRFDPKEVGSHIQERFLNGIERALAVRDRVGDARFYDVDFVELCDNPSAVVNGITQHFGLPDIQAERIEEYLGKKRQDARGKHRYDAERYGLERGAIYERYQAYIERFNIPVQRD